MVKEKHEIWITSCPSVKRIPNHKTRFLPLRPILKDESTTENNIHIIGDIFEQQFQLEPEEDALWHSTIRITSGDLKTVSRIQSAKDLRRDTASSHYDSLKWILPIIGLWHLRYNMLQLIHRLHWGGPGLDSSTLQFAADRWHRTNVLDGKNFAPIEEHNQGVNGLDLLRLRIKSERGQHAIGYAGILCFEVNRKYRLFFGWTFSIAF